MLHNLLESQLKSQFWQRGKSRSQTWKRKAVPQPVTEAFVLGKPASVPPQLRRDRKELGATKDAITTPSSSAKLGSSAQVWPHCTRPPTLYSPIAALSAPSNQSPKEKLGEQFPPNRFPLLVQMGFDCFQHCSRKCQRHRDFHTYIHIHIH